MFIVVFTGFSCSSFCFFAVSPFSVIAHIALVRRNNIGPMLTCHALGKPCRFQWFAVFSECSQVFWPIIRFQILVDITSRPQINNYLIIPFWGHDFFLLFSLLEPPVHWCSSETTDLSFAPSGPADTDWAWKHQAAHLSCPSNSPSPCYSLLRVWGWFSLKE